MKAAKNKTKKLETRKGKKRNTARIKYIKINKLINKGRQHKTALDYGSPQNEGRKRKQHTTRSLKGGREQRKYGENNLCK
jgi:hypothetical protein